MAEAFKLGRYSVFAELASGGMATVYLGRMTGAVGFGRTVAIKRLHPHFSRDPEVVSMFLDEVRLAARIQHPNVVQTLDAVTDRNELFLVLEYVHGETLAALLRAARHAASPVPIPVALAIVAGVLNGLHAAHEAKSELGDHLQIVHRDVSPQNIIVGADGVARVLDFGVAKARSRLQNTEDGKLKGKISYMAPEQVGGETTRQSDIYSAGIVLWETLAGRRLFTADNEVQLLHAVVRPQIEPPSDLRASVSPELDAIVLRALAFEPGARFATAREMAEALDRCMRPASTNQVAEWVASIAGESLRARSELVSGIERHSGGTDRSELRKLIELGPAAPLSRDSGPTVSELARGEPGSRRPGVEAATISKPVTTSKAASSDEVVPWMRASSSRFVALAVILLLGLGLGGNALRRALSPRTSPSAPSPPETSSSYLAEPTTVPGAPARVTPASGDTLGVDAAPPLEAELARPQPADSHDATEPFAVAQPGRKPPARRAKEPGAASAAPPSCNPPYAVDSLGHHEYKPECLGL